MKWIPLDNWHQKPKANDLYSITDGERVLHDMCLIDGYWYHVDSDNTNVFFNPTHYLKLELPK